MSTKQEDLEDQEDELEDDEAEGGDDDDKGGKDGKGSDEKFDESRARKTIENQRKSEKALKKALADATAELKAIKDKDLPAAEKQAKDLADATEMVGNLTKRVRKSALKAEALDQATKLRFRSPTLAVRLIDPDDVDYDEDDEPTNVAQLLKEILNEDPSLKGRVRRKSSDEDDDEDEEPEADGRKRGEGPKGGGDFLNRQIRKAAGRR